MLADAGGAGAGSCKRSGGQQESTQDLAARFALKYRDAEFYLNDAVALAVRYRVERPVDFLAEYFAHVVRGTHVLYREWTYVSATQYNLLCFIRLLPQLCSVFPEQQCLGESEYQQLMLLVCPDYPVQVVSGVFRAMSQLDPQPGLCPATFTTVWSAYSLWPSFVLQACHLFATLKAEDYDTVTGRIYFLGLKQLCSNKADNKNYPPVELLHAAEAVLSLRFGKDVSFLGLCTALVHVQRSCCPMIARRATSAAAAPPPRVAQALPASVADVAAIPAADTASPGAPSASRSTGRATASSARRSSLSVPSTTVSRAWS